MVEPGINFVKAEEYLALVLNRQRNSKKPVLVIYFRCENGVCQPDLRELLPLLEDRPPRPYCSDNQRTNRRRDLSQLRIWLDRRDPFWQLPAPYSFSRLVESIPTPLICKHLVSACFPHFPLRSKTCLYAAVLGAQRLQRPLRLYSSHISPSTPQRNRFSWAPARPPGVRSAVWAAPTSSTPFDPHHLRRLPAPESAQLHLPLLPGHPPPDAHPRETILCHVLERAGPNGRRSPSPIRTAFPPPLCGSSRPRCRQSPGRGRGGRAAPTWRWPRASGRAWACARTSPPSRSSSTPAATIE